MKEKIAEIEKKSIQEIENCTTQKELNELKVKYLVPVHKLERLEPLLHFSISFAYG